MVSLHKATLFIKGTNKIFGNSALSTPISFEIFDAGLAPPVPPAPNITNSEYIYQDLAWEEHGLEYNATTNTLVALEREGLIGGDQATESTQEDRLGANSATQVDSSHLENHTLPTSSDGVYGGADGNYGTNGESL